MAAPKNKTEEERELQLQSILDYWREGLNQTEIASKVGISRPQVSYDLKILFQRFREATMDKLFDNRLAELAKLDHLESTAWEAWERSCLNAEKEVIVSGKAIEISGDGDASPALTVTRTTEGQVGDPRFLEIVRKCVEDRRKIFGLDAPSKTELTGANGKDLIPMNDEQARAILIAQGIDPDTVK